MADKAKDAPVEASEKETTDSGETQDELTPLQKVQDEIIETETKEEETSKPLAEKTEEKAEETEETEETEEKSEETEETKETEEEPKEEDTSAAEKTDGEKETEAEKDDDLAGLLDKPKISGEQKRINKLTAQLRSVEEKFAALEATKGKETKTEDKVYTPADLRKAEKKALEDSDYDLLSDIQEYRMKQLEERLVKRYQDEQTRASTQYKTQQTEWTSIVDSYDYLVDPKEAELFDGSRDMLNLKNHSSLLYKLALQLYTSPDNEEKRKYYQTTQGGQKLAVSDALALIIQKNSGKRPKDTEKVKLKKRLAKAKRRTSLSTGSSERSEDTTSKALTDKERLDDYIGSRKKDLHAMSDSGGRSAVRR